MFELRLGRAARQKENAHTVHKEGPDTCVPNSRRLIMLRASFFGTGLFVALWGVSFLFIDQVTLVEDSQQTAQNAAANQGQGQSASNTPSQAAAGNRAPNMVAQNAVRQNAQPVSQPVSQPFGAGARQAPQRPTGFRGSYSPPASTANGTADPAAGGLKLKRPRVINPPDWAAFSLMSIGAVTMLYAVALPRK